MSRARAVVFAYHDVGVRGLEVLRAGGVDVALVVTHADQPGEEIWFASVAARAHDAGIPVVTPDDPRDPGLLEQLQRIEPDFIFSFYYRKVLPMSLLRLAQRGAFNLHGSLLPKYRGRAPVNWAVLHGETETGATLHEMTEKLDAGAIVAQTAVPILPDDTAREVFAKVVVAAEITLWRALPGLLDGDSPRTPNRLAEGSYFGGRGPEDGRIDWHSPRDAVYNLVRAVAPPFPGAFCLLGDRRAVIEEARRASGRFDELAPGLHIIGTTSPEIIGVCGDGLAIIVRRLRVDGHIMDAMNLREKLSS
jgi:methionyl-tRNA formyltransferase